MGKLREALTTGTYSHGSSHRQFVRDVVVDRRRREQAREARGRLESRKEVGCVRSQSSSAQLRLN